jgi:hypothetical protein
MTNEERVELIEDIQAEIGESSLESVDLTSNLSDAESCETAFDLLENLEYAKSAAESILSNINDQLARIKAHKKN